MIRKPTQTSNESGIQEHVGVYWTVGDKYHVKIPARYRGSGDRNRFYHRRKSRWFRVRGKGR